MRTVGIGDARRCRALTRDGSHARRIREGGSNPERIAATGGDDVRIANHFHVPAYRPGNLGAQDIGMGANGVEERVRVDGTAMIERQRS